MVDTAVVVLAVGFAVDSTDVVFVVDASVVVLAVAVGTVLGVVVFVVADPGNNDESTLCVQL